MGKAADLLLSHMPARTGFDQAYGDIAALQIAAINERFQECVGAIKLLGMRASESGIDEIRSLQDVVPLLFPHTAFKSYPESFLSGKRWDRLTKWLGTVSTKPIDTIDVAGVSDVDSWVRACEAAGHLVSCTSGTTGKPAMLPAVQSDLDFAAREVVEAVQWGSGIRAGDKRTFVSFGATAQSPRNTVTGMALVGAFADLTTMAPPAEGPGITIGSITRMIELRKAIANGTAKPEEIAEFERESAVRQQALDGALDKAVERLIAVRGERLMIMAMWGPLYQLAEAVRGRGYSAKDFHPENGVFLGGELKRAKVPDNYKEFIFETLNLSPRFAYQMYGMQETQTSMPRCIEGMRYHIPAWMVCLPLNKEGDNLLPIGQEPVVGQRRLFRLVDQRALGRGYLRRSHRSRFQPLRLRLAVSIDPGRYRALRRS